MAQLWGGRFQSTASDLMQSFNESFSLDKRLWHEDITASIAHVTMLGTCKIISNEESEALISELNNLHAEIQADPSVLSGPHEDIHSFVEAKMIESLGTIGKKMHTARSRNDQVATDMKLYVKHSLQDLSKLIEVMILTFKEKGASLSHVLMPAYTHLQRAQIVTFSYVLDAYVAMFERDLHKIEFAINSLDESPLGAGALAGTTYPINRELTAELLGFSGGPQRNYLDSVSSRDFIIDALGCFASLMTHMSRFAEDFIIYSSQEFGFVECSDSFATGSSMMPQKKNPDALELIRGKSAKVISLLNAMYTTMKGLPLSYNKDMQEDKAIYFESLDTTVACVQILSGVVEELQVNETRLAETIHKGFLNATELADYLVRKGIAFREAHEIVGAMVLHAINENVQLHELSLETMLTYTDKFEDDIFDALNPATILNQGIKKAMWQH
ncbi:argininosuccinate lyase [Aerococcaceae bacterium DSM 109653]|uniref:Argininosuccinate lyase n=1 Tax=Fundicoccus ignavus TaxID=2664442 RepID=A0A844BWC2_9LACT|nr:argininosuccinate lyase [Fundicoccus ignavus]MRI81939.1 argininosuccinate lyase [Fundicoccus ignavus]